MKAAFLTDLKRLQVREAPAPRLENPREVLLRIETMGVCGSDLHYFRAGGIGAQVVKFPWVVGHECAGTVLEVGPKVQRLRPGQLVAVDPLVACGECDQCLVGRPHTCRRQRFLGCPGQMSGAMAERLVMPAECCFPVPEGMTAVQATLVEPFSIGVYAQRMARLHDGAKIGILGSGPIGLCVLKACRAAAQITAYATDLVEERLAAARESGAEWTGNPRQINVVAAISDHEPCGLDFVFECAGEQETLDQAIELLKPGGTLLIVGIPETERVSFNIDLLRRKELRIENVRRQNHCIAPAIDLLARGIVDLESLATHHFPLAEAQAAFDLVDSYRDGVLKAIVHVSS
jgi:L-iditol 2-dehydrogenase